MKKIYYALFAFLVLLNIGCFEDSEDKANPILTVNVDYTGSNFTYGDMIWVDIYTNAGALIAQNVSACYGGLGLSSATGTLSDEIDPGTYYIIAYLDENGTDWLETNEKYVIYQNTTKAGAPTPLTISEGTTTITISFGDGNTW